MAVEGNQQANGSEDRVYDESNVDGGVSRLEKDWNVKENQGSNISELNTVLACGENPINGTEENNDLMDAENTISGNNVSADEMKNGVMETVSNMNSEVSDVARGELEDNVSSSPLENCTSVVDELAMDGENYDEKAESKRLSDLRERKRSKYLSPPYVNLIKGSKFMKPFYVENLGFLGDGEDTSHIPNLRSSPPPPPLSGNKKKVKKGPRINGKITASSGQLLTELRLIASDCCSYSLENKHFEPTEMFFLTFRSSVFHDECNTKGKKKVAVEDKEKESDGEDKEKESDNLQAEDANNSKSESKKRKRKEKTSNGSKKLAVVDLYDVKVDVASTPSISAKSRKKKKKKQKVDSSQEDIHTTPLSSSVSKKSKKKTVKTKKIVLGLSADGAKPNSKGRPRKKSDVAKVKADENPEEKKRRRRSKDITPILTNDIIDAKPISLVVCLENIRLNVPAEESSVAEIRQKLDEMNSLLGKSEDKLTAGMKVELEHKVQELLQLVCNTPCSSKLITEV